MKWKKISSAKLFEHPRISIYEDEVELPNGKKTHYMHFGVMADAAMVIAINDDGKILLQKEYSYPPDEVLFQLPGGAIDPGEDPLQGASRELAEEAGLSGDLTLLGWFYLHNRRTKQRMFVYEARNVREAHAEKDPEEMFEDHWLTEDEVDQLIKTNEIRNYTALAGWSLYKAKHPTK
jgi:8-oxo-dGTP pyrophosphatase MutT (NUDIX family)